MSRKKTCEYCEDAPVATGLCGKHYSYVWSWMRKGPKRARDHLRKLRVRALVMDGMVRIAPDVPDNVVQLDTHPKFKGKQAAPKQQARRKRRAAG
jgi:hypothetical protein